MRHVSYESDRMSDLKSMWCVLRPNYVIIENTYSYNGDYLNLAGQDTLHGLVCCSRNLFRFCYTFISLNRCYFRVPVGNEADPPRVGTRRREALPVQAL